MNPFALERQVVKRKPKPEPILKGNRTLLTPMASGLGELAHLNYLIGKVWRHEAVDSRLFTHLVDGLGSKVLVRSYLLPEKWYRAFTFFPNVEAARIWLKQPCWAGVELIWFGKSLIIGS